MNAFSGIVTLDGEEVPVTVGLEKERINLMSGDMEIGDWSAEECSITPSSEGKWLIEAESETLTFAPGRPDLFARGVSEQVGYSDNDSSEETESSGDTADVQPEVVTEEPDPRPENGEETEDEPEEEEESSSSREFEVVDGPPPTSATMIGFYLLAGITAILAIWAVISIFF